MNLGDAEKLHRIHLIPIMQHYLNPSLENDLSMSPNYTDYTVRGGHTNESSFEPSGQSDNKTTDDLRCREQETDAP